MTPLNHALKDAERLLAQRDRFEADLRQRLAAKGHPPEVVEEALAWLRERKLVDDRRTLETYLAGPSAQASHSEALRAKLARWGAPAVLVEEALAGRASPDGESLAAALRKRYPKPADRSKAARFLASKGLEPDTIESMLNRTYGEVDGWT